jgi:hypothetical protein
VDSEFERKVDPFGSLLSNQYLYPTSYLARDWAQAHFGGN